MRRAAWGLAALLALLAAVAAAGALLAATATGVRWLADAVTAVSRDRVKFEGIDGHLGVPLGIRKLTIATATQRIEIERLRLEWAPRALWQRQLAVDLLAAQSMRVSILKKDPMPPELPASLRLPLDLRVHVLDLVRLDIVEAGRTLSLRNLRAQLDGTGERYRLRQVTLQSPWADISGWLDLDKDAPFALQGHFDAARSGSPPASARLAVTGTLPAVAFEFNAAAQDMRFFASGEVAPFARVRLPRLLVAGQGINPQQLLPGAAVADMAFSGVFEGRAGDRVLGTFSLSNRLAGRLDENRLPLADLTGAVLGDTAHADFSSLSINLGTAGQFTGEGQWHDGRVTLKLGSPRLNLAGLHRKLYVSRMQTTLHLGGDTARQTLGAEFSEDWGQGRFTLSHADAALRLESASFAGQAGRLTAHGALRLDAGRAFSAEFDAAQINPARFGKFPRARLNARGQIGGALAPELRVNTRFTLPPGEFEGRPVYGKGQLRYENRHLVGADIDLNLAGNLATLKGAYGRAGDRLDWTIDAPALARLNLGLAGRLNSSGSVSGNPEQPQIEAALSARGLRLPGDFAADALDLRLDLQASADAPFNGQLDAHGMLAAGQRLSLVRATAAGRRDAHALALDARMSDWRLTANLQGGLGADRAWRGQLNQAEVQGAWPAKLLAPATLLLSREQQEVSHLALAVAGGRLAIDQLSRHGAQLASRGALTDLPLAPLLARMEPAPPFTTDLRADGEWDLRFGSTLDGRARLRRHSGDVRLKDPMLHLGLTTLALDFNAEASRVSASLELNSREAGQLRGTGQATLLREGAIFVLPRSAPLAWTAQLDMPNLRLLRPVIPVDIRTDARVHARLVGSGSLAAPHVDGQLAADTIRFAVPEEGISITDGTLKLMLADDRVQVQEGVLHGESGRITLSGQAQLKNPQAGLSLAFERFAAVNRSDRRVTVSGTAQLNLDAKQLQLTGELTADRARLETPEASRPTVSSDVVIVGQPPREQTAAQRFPVAMDLKLNLGKDFVFKGGGLDARLGGQMRVFTVSPAPRQAPPPGERLAGYSSRVLRGEGTIQVSKGRYSAYTQTLDIERGVLRFVGPIDNPALDVLAVRKTATVTAGVQVSGTVQRPVVKLYSDPPLPDTEKLSWLVLGHGLDKGGQQEFVVLQVAAGALLSQSESVNFQAKLADTLGIESFDVHAGEGEDLGATVVSVGKRLSSRAMLSYEQSVDGLNQVVKVLYQLTPQVRLEAQAGQQSSFDVFYSLEYN